MKEVSHKVDFCVVGGGLAGNWTTVAEVLDNHQRLVKLDLDVTTSAIRLIPETTWGAEKVTTLRLGCKVELKGSEFRVDCPPSPPLLILLSCQDFFWLLMQELFYFFRAAATASRTSWTLKGLDR